MKDKPPKSSAGIMAFAEQEIMAVLRMMPKDRVAIIADFMTQIAAVHDPDVVETFVAWRSDPRLDSLLQIAAQLDSDALDQLLFTAEDFIISDALCDAFREFVQ